MKTISFVSFFKILFSVNTRSDWKLKDLEPPSEADGQSVAFSDTTQVGSKKRIKYGEPLPAAQGLFEEYCGSSTVHGVRYFGEKNRHWSERAWWIFTFTLALLCCGKLIFNIYVKWYESPVIINFAETSRPVSDIPFPAVTICPETKVNMTQLNFTHIFHIMSSQLAPPYNITDEEEELMAAVVQICKSHLTEEFEVGRNFTDSRITDLLRETAPSLDDTLYTCSFRNEINYCEEYFAEFMTEEGLCFTFNGLNGKELYNKDLSPDYPQINHNMTGEYWHVEEGYYSRIDIVPKTYPYRVFGSGAEMGLFVHLKLYKQHLEYICRGPFQGFKILLHTPGEVPQVSKHYFRVPLHQEVLVSVKPSMITTSVGLFDYEPNIRRCYFASERKLRFLKVYTQRNCELECLANFTLSECGCVKFSMPRDIDTKICGAAKIECYNRAEGDMLRQQFMEKLKYTRAKKGKVCNCLPSCTSITYDAEISQVPFDWKSWFIAYNILDEFTGTQQAQLSIFFKEDQFTISKRSELYGHTEFLANCGGLLGLFMGASFLSIVELLYFFSIKLCCNLRERMNRKRKNRIAHSTVPEIVVVKPASDEVKKE